jgi:hypothetical protein
MLLEAMSYSNQARFLCYFFAKRRVRLGEIRRITHWLESLGALQTTPRLQSSELTESVVIEGVSNLDETRKWNEPQQKDKIESKVLYESALEQNSGRTNKHEKPRR